MSVYHKVWDQTLGDLHLVEYEHMFGFDLIMSRRVEDKWLPTAIVSRQRQMNGLEQTWASRWLAALAGEDYGLAVDYFQRLCEAPLD